MKWLVLGVLSERETNLGESHTLYIHIYNTPLCRYQYLVGNGCCSFQGFSISSFGRGLTHLSLNVLETIKVVPTGTTQVHSMLQVAASSLIDSGKADIFSPMYLILARKPSN